MPYAWLWLLIAQLLLLLPNRWKVSLHHREGSPLSRGLYAISACECLRNVRISLFPRLFPPVQGLYYFYRRGLLLLSYNNGNSVPNHGMAGTLLYPNRGLTYTPCLAYSAARTLRAGGGTHDALLQQRFWSAIARSSLRVEADVASGIKCKYNCARISRLYIASEFRTNPRPRIARHCDPLRLRIFAPRRLRSLQPGKTFVLHT